MTDQDIADRIEGLHRLTYINPGQINAMLRAMRALLDGIEEELGVIVKDRLWVLRSDYERLKDGGENLAMTLRRSKIGPEPTADEVEIEVTVREVKHRGGDTENLQDQADPA